ncbi:type III-A CRISPR-associated protein Csm2 [Prosthecochloris sp. N3]|uniref:CRISPR system Cms protein Csm2 n=1 Tax=Prosthecochloris ethylica TaxID=2743976 RepID=A0ABR9XT94_9CHLB|nr:type III-A CRISPR-associated protein Csm2 [Prosthecochloris ethylica]MBF0586929.1 type III-A CRISPR-associated protein Csm2 [Prosthecochloris ethylica]MBF0637194.1 type III-A CRISPR-associated protein Csm2 [Prosthecochloris ethylica]NUK48202.1 type III-A CRISPR-associated protein Csm2 [Prosthecochloris ethylica]
MNRKYQKEHQKKGGRRGSPSPRKLDLFESTLDGIDVEELVRKAENNAQVFHDKKIKANQIRNFYGAVEKIKMKYARYQNKKQGAEAVKQDFWLLLPQLAYAKGRNGSTWMFCKSMKNAVEKVLDSHVSSPDRALDNFFIYVESVVAYHKFYGDK